MENKPPAKASSDTGESGLERTFPCSGCGADLRYKPGTTHLHCEYCGGHTEIPRGESAILEQDYLARLRTLQEEAPVLQTRTFSCTSCGASTTPPPEVTALSCPFCGSAIVSRSESKKIIAPQALLPFRLDRPQARGQAKEWLSKLWFLPSDLKKNALNESRLAGVYIPYWTFDADCTSQYSGMRGDHYWETETYTATDSQGNTVTRSRQVMKTRWTPAAGTVFNHFDDILVMASQSLPVRYARQLEPWDLTSLVPYDEAYLSGFRAERYQINLPDGFGTACQRMEPHIRSTVKQDIGGDVQQISRLDTRRDNISFKHILLPVWISAYRHGEKAYRLMVNARTGEVRGERPWSVWKIVGLVALIAVLIALAVFLGR